VPELVSLVTVAEDLQTSLDNAEAGLNPLGFPEGALTFDINPSVVVSPSHQTHFEQVYERATQALHNAMISFDDAKDVTRLMRSEEDELSDFQASVDQEELAFKHRFIELYGTPYTDDIGPGKTYKQGYDGPDLFHYAYIDTKLPNTNLYGDPKNKTIEFELDIDKYSINYVDAKFTDGIVMKEPNKDEKAGDAGIYPYSSVDTTGSIPVPGDSGLSANINLGSDAGVDGLPAKFRLLFQT